MSADRLSIGTYEDDEDLLTRVAADERPRTRVVVPDETRVVLGRGSKPELELDIENCIQDGVTVQRRRGGGCSVVLDTGNVIVSIVLPVSGLGGIQTHFHWISDWLTEELAALGAPGIRRRGVSDLAVNERKVGGSCIFRRKDLLYYSTTLLVQPDLDAIERYLRHPPREPEYRAGRAHREFLGTLDELYGISSPDALAGPLRERLSRTRLESHRNAWFAAHEGAD